MSQRYWRNGILVKGKKKGSRIKGRYIVILIVLVVIVAGFGYQAYQFNEISSGLSSEIVGTHLYVAETFFWFIPTKIGLDVDIQIRNESPYSLDVERLVYNVSVEGRDFGHGTLRDIYVPAHSTTLVPISLEFTTMNALRTLWDYIVGGGFEARVSGVIDVPFKFFGLIKIFTISVPHDKVAYVQR